MFVCTIYIGAMMKQCENTCTISVVFGVSNDKFQRSVSIMDAPVIIHLWYRMVEQTAPNKTTYVT